MSCPEFNCSWDVPQRNGFDCFFTEASFQRCFPPKSFEEKLLQRIHELDDKDAVVRYDKKQKDINDALRLCKREEDNMEGDEPIQDTVLPSVDGAPSIKDEVKQGVKQMKGSKEKWGERKKLQNYSKGDEFSFERQMKASWSKIHIPPPPKSDLKHQEQKRFLYLQSKYGLHLPADITEEERIEITEFKNLKKRVEEEQAVFQARLESMATKLHHADYNFIYPAAKKYLDRYTADRRKEIDRYPKFYNAFSSFPIQGTGTCPNFVINRTLLQLGNVPKMVLPSVGGNNQLQIKMEEEEVEKIYPSVTCQGNENKSWDHKPISMDGNAEILSSQHGVHIAVSSAALQCLVDNHAPKFLREWELPVTVREYQVQDGDKLITHRTVYIDRPFYPKEMTTRDKNTKFFKRALKAMISRPSHKGVQFTQTHVDGKQKNLAEQSVRQKSQLEANAENDGKKSIKLETTSHEACEIGKADSKGKQKKTKGSRNVVTAGSDSQTYKKAIEETHIEDLESFGISAVSLSSAKKKSIEMKDEDFLKMIVDKNPSRKNLNTDNNSKLSKPQTSSKSDKSSSNFDTEIGMCVNDRTPDSNSTNCFNESENQQKVLGSVTKQKENRNLPERRDSMVDFAGNENFKDINSVMDHADNKSGFDLKSEDLEEVNGCDRVREWTKPKKLTIGECEEEAEDVVKRTERSRHDSSCSNDSDMLVIDTGDTDNDETSEVVLEPPGSPDANTCTIPQSSSQCKIIPIGEEYCGMIEFNIDMANCPDSPEKMSDRESPTSPEKTGKNLSDSFTPCFNIPLCRESDVDESSDVNNEGRTLTGKSFGNKQNTKQRKHFKDVNREIVSYETDSDEHLIIDCQTLSHDVCDSQSNQGDRTCARRKSARIKAKNPQNNGEEKEHMSIQTAQHEEQIIRSETMGGKEFVRQQNVNEDVEISSLTIKGKSSHETDARFDNSLESPQCQQSEKEERESPGIQEIFQKFRRSSRSKRLSKNFEEISTDNIKMEKVEVDHSDTTDRLGQKKEKRSSTRHISLESDSDQSNADVCIGPKRRGRPPKTVSRGRGRKGSLDSTIHHRDDTSSDASTDRVKLINSESESNGRQTRSNSKRRKSQVDDLSTEEGQKVTLAADSSIKKSHAITRAASKSCIHGPDKFLQSGKGRRKTIDSSIESEKIEQNKSAQSESKERSIEQSRSFLSGCVQLSTSAQNISTFELLRQNVVSTTQAADIKVTNPSPTKRTRSEYGKEFHTIDPLAKKSRVAYRPKANTSQTPAKVMEDSNLENGVAFTSCPKRPVSQGKTTAAKSFSLDSVLQMQERLLHPTIPVSSESPFSSTLPKEAISQFQTPDHHNVTYGLWSLGGFQVLVRTSYHGVVKNPNQQPYFIHLSPKLEFQTDFGMEQNTPSEVARNWISTYIRPACKLVRVKMNAKNTEILTVEELSLPHLIPSTQIFNPANSLLMLQNIFHKLHQLEKGQYVLQHVANSNLCNIKKATESNAKRGCYDLHFHHHNFFHVDEVRSKRVPWIPIDPSILLPYHTKHGRIPATFEPEDFRFVQMKKPFTKKGKGKRAKKKNKKKDTK